MPIITYNRATYELKLAPNFFYDVSWEIWLGNSKSLVYMDQSRFYTFSRSWEIKNI